jgi:hypothetical protein
MIDRNVYQRRVNTLGCCLTLARVYRDQDNIKQSEYYVRLASEYFNEILDVCAGKSLFVAREESIRD